MIKLTFDRLDGLNKIININRTNKYLASKHKKETEYYLSSEIKNQTQAKYERIMIIFNWYEKDRRRDYDNVASAKKYILDALVKSELIPNDNQKHIYPMFIDNFYLDKEKPRVEVVIVDANNLNDMIRFYDILAAEFKEESRKLFIQRENEKDPNQIQLEI